jgi:hypothetical protein
MYVLCSTRESEARRRKVHALKLLLNIIGKSVPFWRSSLGTVVLLRRFICPSLMACLITDNTAFFRLVLQIYTLLWENFKDQLAIELGIWLDQLLIPLLDSPYCNIDQKKDILDLFIQLFKPPEAIIELFYNFDNQTKQNWHIYARYHLSYHTILSFLFMVFSHHYVHVNGIGWLH